MDQLKDIAKHGAADTETFSSAYVPRLELTEGQPSPIAANGGLSYMSFDQDGDAGTAAATEAALRQIAEGEGQAVIDMLDNAPPGPIETKWGTGFRTHSECMAHIKESGIEAPEGGVAVPLRYTIHERPSYTVVTSNALWLDHAREAEANALRKEEQDIEQRRLYFPQVMRDESRSTTRASRPIAPSAWTSSESRWRTASPSARTSTTLPRWSACSTPRWKSSSWNSSRVRRMRSCTTTTCLTRTMRATARRTRTTRIRAVNNFYANIVHNDLNDNSGRVRCRELLTRNLRNFGREQHYTEEQADAKMSRRFMSINLAKPMETVRQNPFVLCAWPSFADQRYITSYRIYDDRVGETRREQLTPR